MRLTQKIRIFPTSEQVGVLWSLSELCRRIYNFSLGERIETWERNNLYSYYRVFPWGRPEWVDYETQQNSLPSLKKGFPQYKSVYSKVLQMVLRTLDADFKSFFTLRENGDYNARPPRFKGKKHFTTMVYNQSGFKVEKGSVTLSHKHNEVPLKFTIPDNFTFGHVYQVSVFYDGGRYYLSVVHEVSTEPYINNGSYQAIDLGITKTVTAVNTQGRIFEANNPRPDKYWNPKTDAIQSKRDHCKKGSRRWKHLHKAMSKRKKKLNNQIKDYQHKLSRKMIDNTKANTLIIGALDVKKMTKSKKASPGLNRSTQNNGYLSRFVRFLTYKADLEGKKVIEISERNTSKRCYACGKEHNMPLWNRTMDCDCGNVIDRDRNSAINIMMRFLSQNAMWTGYQQFVDNLRNTGLPVPLLGVHSQETPCVSVG